MSLVCLVVFLLKSAGKLSDYEISDQFPIIWALFSIADALWVKGWWW